MQGPLALAHPQPVPLDPSAAPGGPARAPWCGAPPTPYNHGRPTTITNGSPKRESAPGKLRQSATGEQPNLFHFLKTRTEMFIKAKECRIEDTITDPTQTNTRHVKPYT